MRGKILVTGGAGYIGSVLVPELLRSGYQVTVLDDFMYRQTSLLDVCHDENLTIIRGDARDRDLLKNHVSESDWVFPLACLTGKPACDKDPLKARTVIIDGLREIFRYAPPNTKIIYPTTNSGYGIGQKDLYCDENTPLKPISLYGELKAGAETIVLDHGNSISLRLATVFGISPRMRLDLLVNDFVYQAVTRGTLGIFEGHFMRNYIHIRDVVGAFIHCMNNFEKMKNQVYNLGLSEANLSKLQLCDEIRKQVPGFTVYDIEGKDPDQRNYIVSNAKLEATGWKANTSLQDGISELIKGYQIIRENQFSNA